MAAPTLETNAAADILRITDGTSGNPVTWNDVWEWGAGGGAGLVPKDGGGDARVDTFITEVVADAVYTIEDDIWFGNAGGDATYFQSKNEMVYFADDKIISIKSNATLELGDLSNNYGIEGSYWSLSPAANLTIIAGGITGTFYLYDSTLRSRNKDFWFTAGTIAVNKGKLIFDIATEKPIFFGGVTSLSVNGLYVVGNVFYLSLTPTEFDNVHIHNSTQGLLTRGNVTVPNLLVTNANPDQCNTEATTLNLKNPEFHPTIVSINAAAGIIIEQYTCNIHVVDNNGDGLANTDIDCEYAHLVEGSDAQTYKCIQDHTAVDATHKPITGSNWGDFWGLYDAGGGLGGDWTTGFDYKAATAAFATQTTDANGDIAEQTLDYKKWTGTSEVLEVRTYKFTLTKAGYNNYEINIFVDRPQVLEITLGDNAENGDSYLTYNKNTSRVEVYNDGVLIRSYE